MIQQNPDVFLHDQFFRGERELVCYDFVQCWAVLVLVEGFFVEFVEEKVCLARVFRKVDRALRVTIEIIRKPARAELFSACSLYFCVRLWRKEHQVFI